MYKRQDQGPFDLACLLRGAQNFLMDLLTEDPKDVYKVLEYCRNAAIRFATVSYTHLDVYKRQAINASKTASAPL